MCRNIKTLFNFEPPATELEIRDASLQFVRKLSGFNVPVESERGRVRTRDRRSRGFGKVADPVTGDKRGAAHASGRGGEGAGKGNRALRRARVSPSEPRGLCAPSIFRLK